MGVVGALLDRIAEWITGQGDDAFSAVSAFDKLAGGVVDVAKFAVVEVGFEDQV